MHELNTKDIIILKALLTGDMSKSLTKMKEINTEISNEQIIDWQMYYDRMTMIQGIRRKLECMEDMNTARENSGQ